MLNEVVSKNYMIAGYAVILTVLALYLISLIHSMAQPEAGSANPKRDPK